MKKRNETDVLNEMIFAEEMKCSNDLAELKAQFYVTFESIKPINLIKKLFHEATASPEIRNDLVSNVIGLGTGFLSKKLLLGSSSNPIKKVLGTIFEFAVATAVSKHAVTIKLIGGNLLKHFFEKKNNQTRNNF